MNIIDIVILAILGLSLVAGMYKGFLASTLALAGFAASWLGALKAFRYLAEAIQGNALIMTSLESVLSAVDLFKTKALADTAVSAATQAQVQQAAQEVGLPLIKDMFQSNVLGKAFDSIGLTTMSEYLTQTLLVALVNVLSFIVMFAVIYFAVLLIVNMLNHVFHFPQLRHLDWMLGGVFGAARGLVIVFLIFAVLPTAVETLSSMDVPLLSDLIADSSFASFFINNNFITGAIANLIL